MVLEKRPITLTGCLCATYMASYKNETRHWDNDYHGWWDDAVKGNSALQSGLLRRRYEEIAHTMDSQQSECSSMWTNFYDSVFAQTHPSGVGADFSKCSTLLCKRTSASESYVQEKWCGRAYSLGWLLLGKQVCAGGTLQHSGVREQRITHTACCTS